MTRHEYLHNLASPTPSLTLARWPKGHIVQGWQEHPELYHTVYQHFESPYRALCGHTGTDIQGSRLTPVHAAQEGTVQYIATDPDALGGICPFIASPELDDHGETVIISLSYAHLDSASVKLGEYVKKGQLIGYMGNTGVRTGTVQPYWQAPALDNTHLHWGGTEYIKTDGSFQVRHPGVTQGSLDVMAYLNGDLRPAVGFVDRMIAYLKSIKGR